MPGRHQAAASSNTGSARTSMKFTGEIGSWMRRLLGVGVPDGHQPVGRRVRQRPKDDGVDDGEDRGGGAGAEAEHQHRDEREARMVTDLTGGGTKGVEHG